MRLTFPWLLLGVGAAGCGTTDSTTDPPPTSGGIATSAMRAELSLESRGDGTAHVYSALMFGTSGVDLVPPDVLVLGAAEATWLPLARQADAVSGFVFYTADVSEPHAPFSITLVRGGQQIISTAELPPAFTVDADASRPLSRANDDLTIRWEPSGGADRMYWYASGGCIPIAGEVDVADNGAVVIPKGALGAGADTCSIAIHVRRARLGTTDGRFHAGEIVAEQDRVVSIVSMP